MPICEGVSMKYVKNMLGQSALLAVSIFIYATTSLAAEPWAWKAMFDGAGSGQAIVMPTALHIDAERQRYYVVDSGGNRLVSFSREGDFLHAFTAEGKLQIPYDMVRDNADVIWVVEKGRNSLTSIDVKAKEILTHIIKDGERTLVPDRIDYKDGIFYVLDKETGQIAILSSDLAVKNWISCSECTSGIVDFKLTNDGIWALDQLDKKVVQFDGEGKLIKNFDIGQKVEFPVSLAIGPAGNVYVLDRHVADIAVFDAQGGFKYSFLAKGWSRGELYFPIEILFDPWGGLCVVEEGNGRVQVFGR
jgi:streptogramin lyase